MSQPPQSNGAADAASRSSQGKSVERFSDQAALADAVGDKARRHIIARGKEEDSLWFGLGAFGVIGWSIALPTVIGIGIGLWIDLTWGDSYAWTVSLMFAGLTLGIFSAWRWMSDEQTEMEKEKTRRADAIARKEEEARKKP